MVYVVPNSLTIPTDSTGQRHTKGLLIDPHWISPFECQVGQFLTNMCLFSLGH